ncbi:MAG: hypothetical protein CVV25_11760 [Ignavibacteriae bacterium HGW-Ignavibacteriae-4]|jgi:hypothetical protein|nr:MAG: hypothetical protein CVV25_11760 [Ignavibacteriae bacterium HGW-Ignavibacteriae-4]
MKNLFIYISLLIAATTLGYSLAPVTVVLNNDGDNITAQLNDYSSGSPVAVDGIDAIIVPTVTANGSGYSSFVVGEGDPDWGDILSTKVNSNVILDIYDNGTLVAQFRLDELQEQTARTEQLPSNVIIGNELKVEGDATFKGENTFKGVTTFKKQTTFEKDSKFEGQVTVTGVLKLKSNEFSDSVDIGDIETNIMVFVGGSDVDIEESSFSNNLVNGATYTLVNNGTGQNDPYFSIDLDNGDYVRVYPNQVVTLIRIGGNLYIVSRPGYGEG